MSEPSKAGVPAPFRDQVRLRRRNWYWLTPALALTLFMVMMGTVLWWLDSRDEAQRYGTLVRDIDWSQQSVRLRMLAARDRAGNISRDLVRGTLNEQRFMDEARDMLAEYPELVHIAWFDSDRQARWVVSADRHQLSGFRPPGSILTGEESLWTLDTAQETRRALWSLPYARPDGDQYMDLLQPVQQGGRQWGVIVLTYSLEELLRTLLPVDSNRKYKISLVDAAGDVLVSSSPGEISGVRHTYDLPMDPPGNGLTLRGQAYRTQSEASQTMLVAIVVALSALIIWSLLALWRHVRFRSEAEAALLAETSFRRAMENSMLTGTRAIDLEGRITYVNPAFCRLIGWDEDDLVGRRPPYPYWPPEALDLNQRNLDTLLQGAVPASGLEIEAQRKDGSRFYARMYVSPLIDQFGVQTGWMTSMTDITEPKRVREALAAAHERFMTVLEGLDDAISVCAEGDGAAELLFANRTYRGLFGATVTGHTELSAGRRGRFSAQPAEMFSPTAKRWFEVRHRTLQWVDGRRVHMQVARDITEKRAAEEASRQQQEKIQLTSRLITMGEMASSLAHELNQPLTAIANYSMGAVARVRSGRVEPDDLLPVLEKASSQAERAGMIIRRIREFVKRSEPNRKRCSIVNIIDNAVGFADIDARKRQIEIIRRLPDDLPDVYADVIMIEQVVLNLVKNGMDAMEKATRREIIIEASVEQGQVQVSVIDAGHGLGGLDPQRLFEPFFSTKPEGMGMGLNICRTIIEFHHGRLWAEPASGGGTVFSFMLPTADNPLGAVPARPAKKESA